MVQVKQCWLCDDSKGKGKRKDVEAEDVVTMKKTLLPSPCSYCFTYNGPCL